MCSTVTSVWAIAELKTSKRWEHSLSICDRWGRCGESLEKDLFTQFLQWVLLELGTELCSELSASLRYSESKFPEEVPFTCAAHRWWGWALRQSSLGNSRRKQPWQGHTHSKRETQRGAKTKILEEEKYLEEKQRETQEGGERRIREKDRNLENN